MTISKNSKFQVRQHPLQTLYRIMNSSHFRNLRGHRVPVLQLYRRLLRHCGQFENARPVVVSRFKKFKGLMSSYITRDRILEGYSWEEKLRRAILDPEGNKETVKYINQEIEKYRHTLLENGKRTTNVSSSKQRNRKHKKRQPDPLVDYNLPPEGIQLNSLKQDNRLRTYRNRVYRNFSDRLSQKSELDQFYLDVFLTPEYRRQREDAIIQQRKKREMFKPPTIRMVSLQTPIAPFALLKVVGFKQTYQLGQHIRRALQDKRQIKLAKLERYLEYAQEQADWEKEVEGDSNNQNKALWCDPIQDAVNRVRKSIDQDKRRRLRYRKRLLRRKKMLENMAMYRHRKKVASWQKSSSSPRVLHPFEQQQNRKRLYLS